MSTVAIVLIVVAVLALAAVALFVFSPSRRAERRLRAERSSAATRHRELATDRHSKAEIAEQRAAEAEARAQRARQEAELHEGRADLHDQGLADHELESGPDAPPETRGDDVPPTGERSGRFQRDETTESNEETRQRTT